MPTSPAFERRLTSVLTDAAEHFGTPFHLYDEQGLRETAAAFDRAFAGLPYREFYAVKALPNPAVLRLLHGHGFGFDCSSLPELTLARRAGATGEDIMFTSNNTSGPELDAALSLGAVVNADDETVVDRMVAEGRLPRVLGLRVNPGRRVKGADTTFLGDPRAAKFGIRPNRLVDVVAKARRAGVRRFGLHMMLASNSLSPTPVLATLDLLLEEAALLEEALGVGVEFLNLGGGIGIPYSPDDRPFDLDGLGEAIRARLRRTEGGRRTGAPRICFESGRFVTGPHGVLVTRVLNRMSKWREFAGVDASMSDLMRPALYPHAYHHITVPGRSGPAQTVDVVGSLCENSDKFGVGRSLPALREGDLVVIHDTGAHGHAMGFTYNGRLRPQELLLGVDGSVELIRRAETEADYFSTLRFAPDLLSPRPEPAR